MDNDFFHQNSYFLRLFHLRKCAQLLRTWNKLLESRDLELTAGTSLLNGPLPVHVTPTYSTCVMGGLGGPGAINATVDAVALLAETGSLTKASTMDMLRRDLTVQMP